jgi:putative ABC transport system permease protein
VTRLRTVLVRLRRLFHARQFDRDVREEIAAHLAEATEDYVRQGLSTADARLAALRTFGNVTRTEEAYREAGSFGLLDHLRRDVRDGIRGLRRDMTFSVVALTVLAIATGATTTVFALLNGIVLQPLPFSESDRLVAVRHTAPGLNRGEVELSSGLYFHYAQHAESFQSFAVYRQGVLNLRLPGAGTEPINVTYAGVNVLKVLGATPALGRPFTEDDAQPGFMNMRWTIPVLLAHDFWISRFGGDPGIVGRILTINDNPRIVIGVLPKGFGFPDRHAQLWMLLEPPRQTGNFARAFNWSAVGRLSPGATPASAQAELEQILPRIAGTYPDATPERLAEARLSPRVMSLKSLVIGDVGHLLWTLLGGMAFLFAIACANVSALFAARAEHRRREVAVRQALGANRGHVTRLFFVEAFLLTATAAALGLALANGALSAVVALAPFELPRAEEVMLDETAVSFAAALAVLMAGFYAALCLRRQGLALVTAISSASEGLRAPRRQWGQSSFILLQVALAITLLVGSALMVKTYRNLSNTELGFAADGLLTVEVGLPSRKAAQHARIFQDVVERVRRLPGVTAASAASFAPLTAAEDVFPIQNDVQPVPFKFFLPGYFQTIGTPIVAGAGFADGEVASAPYPVVVSAALARRLYPGGRSAVGKSLRRLNEDGSIVELSSGPVPDFTVVGIVADVRETTLRGGPAEAVYVPVIEPRVEQSITPTNMTLMIRTQGSPEASSPSVRGAIAAVDPGLSVGQVRTMNSIVQEAKGREAFVGALLVLAAAIALLLGVVGIYGNVTYIVVRRRREIGIRMALGARRGQVVRTVVAGTMRAVIIGALLGIAVALAGTRILSGLLFGVGPRDPITYLAITGVLLSAAFVAALAAARRATDVAPVLAMRSDG